MTSPLPAIILILSLLLTVSCQKEKKAAPNESEKLVSIHNLGDTLTNSSHTSFEETEIIFDSISQIGFRLTSNHSFIPSESESYFIRIEFDYQDEVKLLANLANGGFVFSGPILSTFNFGDTIEVNMSNDMTIDWYPKYDNQISNTGWLKYHIYTEMQGAKVENIKIGENYLVYKFGEIGNERIGWLNVVYQDTLCYIKEGYYNVNIDCDIIVGEK